MAFGKGKAQSVSEEPMYKSVSISEWRQEFLLKEERCFVFLYVCVWIPDSSMQNKMAQIFTAILGRTDHFIGQADLWFQSPNVRPCTLVTLQCNAARPTHITFDCNVYWQELTNDHSWVCSFYIWYLRSTSDRSETGCNFYLIFFFFFGKTEKNSTGVGDVAPHTLTLLSTSHKITNCRLGWKAKRETNGSTKPTFAYSLTSPCVNSHLQANRFPGCHTGDPLLATMAALFMKVCFSLLYLIHASAT